MKHEVVYHPERHCPECRETSHNGEHIYACEVILWEEEWGSPMIDNSKLPTMDGVKVEFISGAKRVEQSIPDYSGIPPFILRRLALIFEEGRIKYGERNWTRGLPTSSTMNHLIEHLMRWMEGDTTEDHLSKAMWGIVCLMYTMEHHADLHDADWSDSIARTDDIYRSTKTS